MGKNKYLDTFDGCQYTLVQGKRAGEACGKPLPKQVDSQYCYNHTWVLKEQGSLEERPYKGEVRVIEEKPTRYELSFSFRSDEKTSSFMLEQFMSDFLREIKSKPGKVNFHISVTVKDI